MLNHIDKAVCRNTVEFSVSAQIGLVSDPITRPGGEKCTYPIPTYECLRGILQSIYWKPTIIWIIDSVRVMNRIQTERKGIRPIHYGGGNDLAYYTYLTNVKYQVRAHFEWNENRPELAHDRNENKHHNMAKRFIERGGRRDIFIGCRECQGYAEPCDFGEGDGFYDNSGEISYGLMYHGITYADEAVNEDDRGMLTVRFWNPVMNCGVINFIRPEQCTVKRHIRKMEMKHFGEDNNSFSGLNEFAGGGTIELD